MTTNDMSGWQVGASWEELGFTERVLFMVLIQLFVCTLLLLRLAIAFVDRVHVNFSDSSGVV